MRRRVSEGLRAGLVAGALAGLPSTVEALARGGDPLSATRAAGSVVLGDDASERALVAGAIPVHLGLSCAWGVILAAVLPARATVAWGAGAGLAIAALDLGVLGRRFPAIAALPVRPQVADHVAFGAIAGWILRRR